MKAKSIIILCILIFFTIFCAFGAELGDVNDDSFVDIVDALLIAQFYVGSNPNVFDQTVADVNGDNSIDIIDSLLIAKYYVGEIDWPPPGGITPTPIIEPTPEPGFENIINGDFANGTANWNGGYYSPGAGSMSVNNGELHIGITNGGEATWNVQINQGNINIVSGTKYTFSFDARAVSSRTIEANVGMSASPYTSYFASSSLTLTTTMTTYSFTFTGSANDPTARVEFNCGLDTNDVYIDNVSLIGGATAPTPEPIFINFPDPNLEAAIREEINKPDGPIYTTDVYSIARINLGTMDIKDTTGLENLSGLSQLYLNNNYHLTNITPIEQLTNLSELVLSSSFQTDITPVANLTNLTNLSIKINKIIDISPIANLTNLRTLSCQFNDIIDITPLANLTKMNTLTLYDNHIIDITPLENLTNVTYLDVSNNEISDITPLANLTKLSILNLCGNPISDITALENLTNLTKLVINVRILEDVTPLANLTKLVSLNLKNNNISDISALANLTNLSVLSLYGNPLNASAEAVINYLEANGVMVDIRPDFFE